MARWKTLLTIGVVLVMGSLAQAAITASDVVAYYSLDTDASDATTQHNGALEGPATIQSAKAVFGSAVSMETAAGQIRVLNDAELNPGIGSFTFSAWMAAKSSGFNGAYMVQKGADVYSNGVSNGNWNLTYAGQTAGNFMPWFQRVGYVWDRWALMVFVVDRENSQLRGYVGQHNSYGTTLYENIVTLTATGGVNNISDLIIGGSGFNGWLDDVAVYNRALTLAEIQSLHNGGAGAALGSLVDFTPVPEPATMSLLAVAAASVLVRRRRK